MQQRTTAHSAPEKKNNASEHPVINRILELKTEIQQLRKAERSYQDPALIHDIELELQTYRNLFDQGKLSNPYIFILQGMLHERLYENDQAFAVYEAIRKAHPHYYNGYAYAAGLLNTLGKHQESKAMWYSLYAHLTHDFFVPSRFRLKKEQWAASFQAMAKLHSALRDTDKSLWFSVLENQMHQTDDLTSLISKTLKPFLAKEMLEKTLEPEIASDTLAIKSSKKKHHHREEQHAKKEEERVEKAEEKNSLFYVKKAVLPFFAATEKFADSLSSVGLAEEQARPRKKR